MKMRIMKKTAAIAFVCAFCFLITSCSMEKGGYKYSSAIGNWQSTKRYIVTDLTENYILHDKQTGEKFSLVRDPFAESSVSYVSVCGENAYYIENYGDEGSWRINEIDLESFSTTTIYERDKSESAFLGLSYKQTDLNSFLYDIVSRCMVTDDCLFLELGLKGLLRVDRVTGQEKMVLRDISSNGFCSDGEKIYYITDEMRPKSYSIHTEEEKILTDNILVQKVCLMSEGLLVLQEYGGGLFLLNTSDESEPHSLNVSAEHFTADSENIFFTNADSIYRVTPDESPVLLCEGDFVEIDAMNDDEYLYFLRRENNNYVKGIINKYSGKLVSL